MSRDYIQLAADYQAGVLSGSIPGCSWVRLACERNRTNLDRQSSERFPYIFSPSHGRAICQMAEMLPHVKGPKAYVIGKDDQERPIWNPIVLEGWQCWILTTLFGWIHAQTRLRRFRTALILIPRKNAKSTLGAIIALYMLTADGESGAEVYSAATTRDQSKVVGEIAWEMARRSPGFRDYFGVRVGAKTTRVLEVPGTASKFMPLSADAHSLDGLNVSCAIIDELHAHRTSGVYDVIDTATGARSQPLLAAITTAGVEFGGICHQKLGYLHKVLDGVAQDDTFFGIEFTIDANDDIKDPAIARKSNPNYGVSVDPDDLQRKINEAQHSQAALNNILTKHFNVWIRTESGWMTGTVWQTCTAGLTWEQLKSYPCWIGVDLGEVRDFSALVLLFKTGPETFAVIPFIYVPENAIIASPITQLSGFKHQGHVVVTPGDEADYQRIEDDLLLWWSRLQVKEIDFDRRSARLMMQKIRQRLEPSLGKDKADQVVLDIPQGLETMDPAMKMAERLVYAKHLQHDGNECMAWMVSNVVIERNHKDEIFPRKAGGKDSHNKIDGPVAFFTCLSQAMQSKDEQEPQMFFVGGRR